MPQLPARPPLGDLILSEDNRVIVARDYRRVPPPPWADCAAPGTPPDPAPPVLSPAGAAASSLKGPPRHPAAGPPGSSDRVGAPCRRGPEPSLTGSRRL